MIEFIHTDDYTGIMVGIAFIAAGCVAGWRPQWITTYRHLSPEKRKNIAMKGLGRHMMIGLILMGGVVIVTNLLITDKTLLFFVQMLIIFVGILTLLGTAQRYDHNK